MTQRTTKWGQGWAVSGGLCLWSGQGRLPGKVPSEWAVNIWGCIPELRGQPGQSHWVLGVLEGEGSPWSTQAVLHHWGRGSVQNENARPSPK